MYHHLRKDESLSRIPKEPLSTKPNQYYILQVSQMEVKISELKAQLEAKNKEIQYLTSKLERAEEQAQARLKESIVASNITVKELETKIAILEGENRQLKSLLGQNTDAADIKIELEYALRMKQIFEEKYREAKSLQLRSEIKHNNYVSDPRSGLNKSQLMDLQHELEDAQKEKERAERRASQTDEENKKLHKKVEELDKTNAELNRKYITSLLKIRDLENKTSIDSYEEEIIVKPAENRIKMMLQEENPPSKSTKISLPVSTRITLNPSSQTIKKSVTISKAPTKEMPYTRTIKSNTRATHQATSEPPKNVSLYSKAISKGLSIFNRIPQPFSSSQKKTVKFPDMMTTDKEVAMKPEMSAQKRNYDLTSPKIPTNNYTGILKNKQQSKPNFEKPNVPKFTISLDKSSSNETFGDEFPDEDELN